MTQKLHLIRGGRIVNQIKHLIETAFPTLRANAAKLPAGDRELDSHPIQIRKLVMTPFEQTGQLQVDAEAASGPKVYKTTIAFQEVEYQETDEANNITFTGSDRQSYNMTPIPLASTNVKVSCECLDFYWRFATYNSNDGSLQGKVPPAYTKKTDKAPVNPARVPGVCKHLIKTIDELKQSGIVR